MLCHKEQSGIPRSCGRFTGHHFDQIMENLIVEIVDLCIALNDLASGSGIVPSKGIKRRAQHCRATVAHFTDAIMIVQFRLGI